MSYSLLQAASLSPPRVRNDKKRGRMVGSRHPDETIPMKIDIWSDYACPFCYIGMRHLEEALAQFEQHDAVQIARRAFELNPAASRTVESTTQQRLEQKYRKTPEEARQMIEHIEQMAMRAGIDMRYATAQSTNTFDAHRLTKMANAQGKGAEMEAVLFKAYFTRNRPLADHQVLLDAALSVGLDQAEAQALLDGDLHADAVRQDEAQAAAIGVQGVPFFVIDNRFAVSGAQPPAQLLAALRHAASTPDERGTDTAGATCG